MPTRTLKAECTQSELLFGMLRGVSTWASISITSRVAPALRVLARLTSAQVTKTAEGALTWIVWCGSENRRLSQRHSSDGT